MKLLIPFAATLALWACAVTPPPTTQVNIAKGEYAFEVTYSAAASAYLTAEPSLSPAVKAKAKSLLLQMLDCDTSPCTGYVQVARNAVAASDATTLAAQVSEITSVAAQVTALIKGH